MAQSHDQAPATPTVPHFGAHNDPGAVALQGTMKVGDSYTYGEGDQKVTVTRTETGLTHTRVGAGAGPDPRRTEDEPGFTRPQPAAERFAPLPRPDRIEVGQARGPQDIALTTPTGTTPGGPGSVAARTREIADEDSPLMRQARTAGQRFAAQRGLLSSSLAAQAAQDAVIGRAEGIAQSDVSEATRARIAADDARLRQFGLHTDRYQAEKDVELRAQSLMQDFDLKARGLEIDDARRVADAWHQQQQINVALQNAKTQRMNAQTNAQRAWWDNTIRVAQLDASVMQNAFNRYASRVAAIVANTQFDANTRRQLLADAKQDFLTETRLGREGHSSIVPGYTFAPAPTAGTPATGDSPGTPGTGYQGTPQPTPPTGDPTVDVPVQQIERIVNSGGPNMDQQIQGVLNGLPDTLVGRIVGAIIGADTVPGTSPVAAIVGALTNRPADEPPAPVEERNPFGGGGEGGGGDGGYDAGGYGGKSTGATGKSSSRPH